MNDLEKLVLRDILQETVFYKRLPTKGRMSSPDIYIKNDLDKDVRRFLNLDTKIKGKGIGKIVIPSNIIDIYTRLEVFLGLKLFGQSETLTEASNLIDELYKRGEIQNKQQYRNALNKFFFQHKMELRSKLLEQIAFNTRPKIEEHMLISMDKSTHEGHFSQPLQPNNKQFKVAVTFLTAYDGIFNVESNNNNFFFQENNY